jgi:branched-chain amino acid aminotransferase
MNLNQRIYYFNGRTFTGFHPDFPWNNRAFRYGDGFFESIRVRKNKILFLEEHVERMKDACSVLKLTKLPPLQSWQKLLTDLQAKHEIINGSIRIFFFRSGDGKYLPHNNEVNFVIELEKHADKIAPMKNHKISIKAGIYNDLYKVVSPLGRFKSTNASIYTLASLYAEENHYQDCLILNKEQHVVEATSSNIFLLRGNTLTTPPLSDGCVAGVVRTFILKNSDMLTLSVHEQSIQESDLIKADLVFLTNSFNGFKIITQFKEKTYEPNNFEPAIQELTNLLNY